VNSLVSAKMRGAAVHVVLSDATPTASQASAVMQLKTAGISVVSVHTPYIHAKTVVTDSKMAYVGSENFTTGSLQYNRELGVFVTDLTQVQKILTTIDGDFANGTAL
jgi:phosphatidylserine/phosphatidylglycerophosphate/cardiolipin synthase-like enzyme